MVSILLYGLVVLVSLVLPDREYARTALVGGTMVIILPLFNLLSAVLRAHFHVGTIAALNVGMLVVQVMLLLTPFWDSAADAMFINVITSLGQVVVTAFIVWRLTRDNQERFDFHPRQWLRDAFPFAIAGLLGAIQLRLGLLLLTVEANKVAVGLFAAATRFIDLARIPLMSYHDTKFPSLSATKDNPIFLRQVVKRLLMWSWAYGMLGGILLVVFAPYVLFIFGERYGRAADVLQWLGFAFPLVALRGGLNVYCYAVGYEKVANWVAFVALVVAILASLTQPMNALVMAQLLFFVEAFSVLGLVLMLAFKVYATTKSPYIPAES
jgi:O-antigen/teichoic acid export membrane protein